MDAHSEAKLSYVHPVLAEKIRKVEQIIETEFPGIQLGVSMGFRTSQQQHALWLQGRADLFDVNACRLNCGLGSIPADQNYRVTKANSGMSWHNYGLAVDVFPSKGGIPIWDETNAVWPRIVAVGESLGLRSGKSWKDEPHFEYTGKFGPDPTPEVIQTYQEANVNGSGTKAVWELAGIPA